MSNDIYVDIPESLEACDRGYSPEAAPPPQSLPSDERPRERLQALGPAALSDQELLSIILNSGIRGKHVSILAAEVLDKLEQTKDIPPVKELALLPGLGQSKASLLIAMLEFGRRRWGIVGGRIRHPADIYRMVRHYADRRQERFLCISLNGAHEALALRVVTIGLVNRTIVHPREVFADPILDRASAVCVAHNHPSGQLEPSTEDDDITFRLKEAAGVLGINFLDHLIFSDTGYFSYCQKDRLSRAQVR